MFLILQSRTVIAPEFLTFIENLHIHLLKKISLTLDHHAYLFDCQSYLQEKRNIQNHQEQHNLELDFIKTCEQQSVDYHFIDEALAQKLINTIKKEPLANNTSHDFFSLLAMDMDSTLITIECIDELADIAGKKAEVSSITQATMRGEIMSFTDSLKQRVKLLKGLSVNALQDVLTQRVRYMKGVEELIAFAHEYQLKTVLLSGGFTYFTSHLQQKLHLTHHFANHLVIDEATQTLTGEVYGDIIDGEKKKELVLELCHLHHLHSSQVIAVGDGSNDLPMIQIAGLGIAAHAKPIVQKQAPFRINHVGLEGIVALFKLFAN